MQPKKTAKYECHYPLLAEDSAYHYTNCNWQYADSLRTHYAKYKDSVAYDWVWSEDEQAYKTLYTSIDGEVVVENTSYIALQDYVVPAFFAIIITFFIFGALVMRDNSAAQRSKDDETILGFINKRK
jgi:hypothetical protein